TSKATEAPSNANKHLAENIFAVVGTGGPQVAEHRRSERGEDIVNRRFGGGLVRPTFHSHRYSGCCHGAVVVLVLVVDSVVVDVPVSFVPLVVAVGSSGTVVVVGSAATVVVGCTGFAGVN